MPGNKKQKKVFLFGVLISITLILLSAPPWFSPPGWAKSIVFKMLVTVLLLLSLWQALFSKDENYRKMNVHELMAMLYRPLIDNKLEEYDVEKMKKRAELFKKLPVKYFNGAVFFFRTLEKVLHRATTNYFYRLRLKIRNRMKLMLSHLENFGAGIQRLVVLLKTMLLRLKKSSSYLLSYVLITYRILMTIIKNRIKNLKN